MPSARPVVEQTLEAARKKKLWRLSHFLSSCSSFSHLKPAFFNWGCVLWTGTVSQLHSEEVLAAVEVPKAFKTVPWYTVIVYHNISHISRRDRKWLLSDYCCRTDQFSLHRQSSAVQEHMAQSMPGGMAACRPEKCPCFICFMMSWWAEMVSKGSDPPCVLVSSVTWESHAISNAFQPYALLRASSSVLQRMVRHACFALVLYRPWPTWGM